MDCSGRIKVYIECHVFAFKGVESKPRTICVCICELYVFPQVANYNS